LGADDGQVARQMPDLLPDFKDMVAHIRPTRICCGAFEQGHIDHDATNLLVNRSYSGPIFEIPFYHTYLTRLQVINRFSDPRGQEVLDLDFDDQRFKIHIARQYPTQNIWSVLLWYEIAQRARLRPMRLAKTERMRLQSHRDFLTPNHPPKLAAKVARSSRWQEWVDAVTIFQGAGSP
jgi:hypothetical protein